MCVRIASELPGIFACALAAVCCLPGEQSKSDESASAAPRAVDPMLGKAPGDVRDDNGLQMKLVWCPPGAFRMENVELSAEPVGTVQTANNNDDDDPVVVDESPPAGPQKKEVIPVKVFLKHGYWLGKYEVTRSEWKLVMPEVKSNWQDGNDIPATQLGWNDAMEFCRRLTERERGAGRIAEGWEYTLPTEAQWERACRARTETAYCFGNDESKLVEYGWFNKNASDAGEPYPHPVGQKKANAWGLYDMHGNVWEWCRDIFVDRLPGGRDPLVKVGGTTRVVRGASWRGTADGCRSSHRLIYKSSPQGSDVGGFRVALCRTAKDP